jgi:hypothetical protein
MSVSGPVPFQRGHPDDRGVGAIPKAAEASITDTNFKSRD